MIGFLVGYESGNIYRIYHPMKKKFKVSRDVIFSETQFFNMRNGKDIDAHNLEFENYDGTLTWDESGASCWKWKLLEHSVTHIATNFI
jgi:hypothetical protein